MFPAKKKHSDLRLYMIQRRKKRRVCRILQLPPQLEKELRLFISVTLLENKLKKKAKNNQSTRLKETAISMEYLSQTLEQIKVNNKRRKALLVYLTLEKIQTIWSYKINSRSDIGRVMPLGGVLAVKVKVPIRVYWMKHLFKKPTITVSVLQIGRDLWFIHFRIKSIGKWISRENLNLIKHLMLTNLLQLEKLGKSQFRFKLETKYMMERATWFLSNQLNQLSGDLVFRLLLLRYF